MKYNLKNEFKKDQAIKRFKKLLDLGATIKLEEVKGKRSLSQNALMWLWLTCIESETGNSKDDLHEYFKLKWLGIKSVEVLGDKTEVLRSTKELDTNQFTKYLEKIQDFAGLELGIELPEPGHKHFDDFYKEYI